MTPDIPKAEDARAGGVRGFRNSVELVVESQEVGEGVDGSRGRYGYDKSRILVNSYTWDNMHMQSYDTRIHTLVFSGAAARTVFKIFVARASHTGIHADIDYCS